MNPGDLLQIDSRPFNVAGQGIMLHQPSQRFVDDVRERVDPLPRSSIHWDKPIHAASCWPMLVLCVLEVNVGYEDQARDITVPTYRCCFPRDYPFEEHEEPVPRNESELAAWNGDSFKLDPPRLVMVHDSHNDANRIFWTCV